MAFHYKLETLLRLQRSLEHQEENRLLACVASITSLKNDICSWENARKCRRESIWRDLEQGAPGAVLQVSKLWEEAAHSEEKRLRQRLQLAEQAREKQLRMYRAARQKRETLESLKENGENAYVVDVLRRMQQDLDEAYLLRSFYRHND